MGMFDWKAIHGLEKPEIAPTGPVYFAPGLVLRLENGGILYENGHGWTTRSGGRAWWEIALDMARGDLRGGW